MKGIVQKPQFDSSVFKQGIALRVLNKSSYDIYNCLVRYCSPLKLGLYYVDKNIEEIEILIEDINYYTISFLVPEKEDQ